MQNIEIKAPCRDLAELRTRLGARGVALAGRLHQVDTYFVAQQGRLKLRECAGAPAELIQYARPDEARARASDYVIVPVPDPAALKHALARALGVAVVVEKHRELYLWGATRVHLDEVRGLGGFVELETVVRAQTVDDARAECREVQRALGIEDAALVARSYSDLLGAAPAPA